MKAVSSLPGIESLAMDMNEKKMTIIGNVDPVEVVNKLKKSCFPQILTVGPAKEPEKKDGEKKEDKKDEKKDEKKDDDKKKSESEQIAELLKLYKNYTYYSPYCHVYSVEENPNACAIS
ncbi:heavy metal-associated isoprenylated plant protein 39-like isoform X2 [Salvia miltiorrhiza]|nr:heavy metal-associated isoprenylated plant protein 39-like isoform X2 [Salvia miltiorrhiza]XP_057802798.1 heavy metal-associated isoprenylated plant protein 39-like isoform X2 [Salvia miltiorrhiza]